MLFALKSNQGFLSLIGQDKIPFDDVIYVCHFVNNELVHTWQKLLMLWLSYPWCDQIPSKFTLVCATTSHFHLFVRSDPQDFDDFSWDT